jgi:hypothetical protein
MTTHAVMEHDTSQESTDLATNLEFSTPHTHTVNREASTKASYKCHHPYPSASIEQVVLTNSCTHGKQWTIHIKDNFTASLGRQESCED